MLKLLKRRDAKENELEGIRVGIGSTEERAVYQKKLFDKKKASYLQWCKDNDISPLKFS